MKESREHRLVVDAVAGELARWCDEVAVGVPEPMRLTSVTHLTTRVSGRLKSREASAVDLALALHPTPAVNGSPRAAAFDAIARLERFDRDSYGGPVGWVDARGDGEFAVAIRARRSTATAARLLAGPASSPVPTPTPNGPRPRPSSNPCSARSSARNSWRRQTTGDVQASGCDRRPDALVVRDVGVAIGRHDEHAHSGGLERGPDRRSHV